MMELTQLVRHPNSLRPHTRLPHSDWLDAAMTRPRDKMPNPCGTPDLDDWMQSERGWNLRERRPVTDWLAVLGVGSAVIAFLLWAWPA